MSANEPSPKGLLTSWKEIAEYLGVSVRTAQKWEAEMGLPIHRLPGKKGRVSAEASALDEWKRRALAGPHWWASVKFFRVYAAVATALVVVAAGVFLGGYLASNRKGPPARFHFESKSLVVTDERGRELWRKTFEDQFGLDITPEDLLRERRAWFGDLDDDRHVELLFTYDPSTRERNGSFLICFSDQGKEKWRFVPGKTVSSLTETFPPPYLINRLAVAPPGKDRVKTVLVTSHHLTWYPNQFVALSSGGTVLGEYWHSGQLNNMDLADLDGDGSEEVLLAGVNNGYGAATLVVLDPLNLGGASVEENRAFQLQGFAPGREKARLLFPRGCINRKFERYNWPTLQAAQVDSIVINVRERGADFNAAVIYRFDKNLRLVHFAVSDRLRALHKELEAAGQLDHALTDREIAELGKIRVLKALGPPAVPAGHSR